jgi:hypothetical protein
VFYLVLKGAPADGKWNTFTGASNLYGGAGFSLGAVFLTEAVITAGCDRQRDHEELPGGICTDSNWPFANAVSLDRNSDLQCFTESCPLDCDCVIWRFRSTRLSLVMVAPIFGGVVGGIIGRWLRQE